MAGEEEENEDEEGRREKNVRLDDTSTQSWCSGG